MFCQFSEACFNKYFACRDANKKPKIVRKNISTTPIQAKIYGHLIEHVPILNWSLWFPHTERIMFMSQPMGYMHTPNRRHIALNKRAFKLCNICLRDKSLFLTYCIDIESKHKCEIYVRIWLWSTVLLLK